MATNFFRTYEETREFITSQLREQFPTIATETGTVIGSIIEIATGVADEAAQRASSVLDGVQVQAAIGTDLEEAVAVYGITRRASTNANVLLTFTNASMTDEITLLAGTEVETANGEPERFALVEDITIPADSTAQVEAEAVQSGVLVVLADTVNVLVTAVANLTVTNPNPSQGGTALESDLSLRRRFFLSLQGRTVNTEQSLLTAVLSVVNVTRALILTNEDNFTISIYVEGGRSVNIGRVVLIYLPIHITSSGSITETYTDIVEGETLSVSFSRPISRLISVGIDFYNRSPETEVQDSIRSGIEDLFSEVEIGSVLYASDITKIIQGLTDEVIRSVRINFSETVDIDVDAISDALELGSTEVPVLTGFTISTVT